MLRGLTPGDLAGGFGLPGVVPTPSRIQEGYRHQLALLPPATQLLLLVAAAEPAGDAGCWYGGRPGTSASRLRPRSPRSRPGSIEFSGQVRFCHPQARAAVYRAATRRQRQSVHRALAETAGSDIGPDQRAWHRAQATSQPDEDVAAELMRSAGQARARGGLAAVAAFGERAAELTPELPCRARRALSAAEANWEAGALDSARRLLAAAQSGPLDELGWARAELLRAQLAARQGRVPTRCRSYSTRPSDWNHSMPRWPARPTARRSVPR